MRLQVRTGQYLSFAWSHLIRAVITGQQRHKQHYKLVLCDSFYLNGHKWA